VMSKVGLKRSAIYELIKQGKFPAPINLGPRAVAWISDETETWIDERIAASRTSAGGR
jgi:prophage regulatory protein